MGNTCRGERVFKWATSFNGILTDICNARTAPSQPARRWPSLDEDRIRQEIRKVGCWQNDSMRELLTPALVRDLDKTGICPAASQRDLAQRLVALAKGNHENLTRTCLRGFKSAVLSYKSAAANGGKPSA